MPGLRIETYLLHRLNHRLFPFGGRERRLMNAQSLFNNLQHVEPRV